MPESGLDAINKSLGRMEGKLDAALSRIDGHDSDIQATERKIDDHGNRIVKLETTNRLLWGVVSFALAAATVVAAFLAVGS